MYLYIKRFYDIFFSSLALGILCPVLIPVIIGLKLTGEGEVFYRQQRVGYKNQLFGILKFATMLKDSATIGSGLVTVRNDPRVTTMGKFLRRYKINELPQLLNVFVGDMSFVGPRPLPATSVAKYSPDVQAKLYDNRPGVTGVGSLIFRDEEKLISIYKAKGGEPLDFYRSTIYPHKGALEMWYSKNISFMTDLKILILTALSIVNSKSQWPQRWLKGLPKINIGMD
jgi:lipopolysaccharide/colanic/teichoic acid biosynthesis glycosyltransferase